MEVDIKGLCSYNQEPFGDLAEWLQYRAQLAIAERLDGILTEMKAMNKVETRTQIVPSKTLLNALQKIHESSHDDNPKVDLSKTPTA